MFAGEGADAHWPRRHRRRRESAYRRGGIGAHVSGCAKGCAKPSATPLTLVANGGLFDLIHNGAASDAPAATGLTLAEIADVVARNGLMEASCPGG